MKLIKEDEKMITLELTRQEKGTIGLALYAIVHQLEDVDFDMVGENIEDIEPVLMDFLNILLKSKINEGATKS